MNCKPGDLAVVIRGEKSSGLIVRVLRAAKHGDDTKSKCGCVMKVVCRDRPIWHLDGFVWRIATDGVVRLVPLANDEDLRPIRDNPGDESFVTESRKFLSAPLERAKPAEVEA